MICTWKLWFFSMYNKIQKNWVLRFPSGDWILSWLSYSLYCLVDQLFFVRKNWNKKICSLIIPTFRIGSGHRRNRNRVQVSWFYDAATISWGFLSSIVPDRYLFTFILIFCFLADSVSSCYCPILFLFLIVSLFCFLGLQRTKLGFDIWFLCD